MKPSNPLEGWHYLSTGQDWLQGAELFVDKVKESGNPAAMPLISMAQDPPSPCQLHDWIEDPNEIWFCIAQRNRQRRNANTGFYGGD